MACIMHFSNKTCTIEFYLVEANTRIIQEKMKKCKNYPTKSNHLVLLSQIKPSLETWSVIFEV